MLWKKIVATAIVCLIIGYFIGVHLPYNWGAIMISDTPISKAEYYQLVTSIFEAIGTCAAVIVALFLNEIRACFKKVSFDIALSSEDALEEVEDIKGTKKALKYYNHIEFFNKGNINAQNCELYLENAEFFLSENNKNCDSFSVGNEPINWGNNSSPMVYVPSQGKKILRIFEMIAPQKQSNPTGKDDNIIPAQYSFLGFPHNVDAKKGKWELIYCLNSTNSKPQRFKLSIEWNGEWEGRQADMKKLLTMKMEQL